MDPIKISYGVYFKDNKIVKMQRDSLGIIGTWYKIVDGCSNVFLEKESTYRQYKNGKYEKIGN